LPYIKLKKSWKTQDASFSQQHPYPQ